MQILTTIAKRWRWSLGLTFLISIAAYAGLVSRIHTFSDGDILTADQMNAEFDNVVDGVNSITDDNIASGAAINPVKISSNIAGSGLTRNTSTGQLTPTVDGTTIEVGGSGLKVKSGGIGTTQIADAVAGSGLAKNGSAIDVQVDGSTLEINSDTLRVKDGGITQAKRAALGQQISSSSGTFTTTSSSYVDVTNLSVTITTTGRPVVLAFVADGSSDCIIGMRNSSSAVATGALKIKDASGDISSYVLSSGISASSSTTMGWPCSMIHHIFVPSAGSHTYTVQAKITSGSTSVRVENTKLVAYEL